MVRFGSWLDRELAWPIMQGREAIIAIPILLLLVPLAARDELFSSRLELIAYVAIAGALGTFWIVEMVRSISRTKEAFHRKEIRPILGKEYKDG